MDMTTTPKARELIKQFEGLRLTAYQCSAGKWTIGYGHTRNVFRGMVITKAQAEAFFEEDLASCEKALKYSLTRAVTPHQFSALVSLAFNIGTDKLRKSTLLRRINNGSPLEDIRSEWLRWVYVTKGGAKVVEPGLVARRKKELELFQA